MNPYFTFAAVLACGLYGIKNQLPLTRPPLNTSSSTAGSAATLPVNLERLPKTLKDACANMGRPDSMARKVLGNEFVDHFVATRLVSFLFSLLQFARFCAMTDLDAVVSRENEWELFSSAVTDWELRRYLELA